LAAAAFFLSGCNIGSDYKRPETPVSPKWLAGAEPAAWPSAEWWHGFRSPALDTYIAQAQAANYDLAAAVARVREADAQARIAGAALLPSVGATAGVTHERAPQASSNALSTKTVWAPGVSASYEIDFWGKNRAALAAAEATAAASRYDRATVALTIETGSRRLTSRGSSCATAWPSPRTICGAPRPSSKGSSCRPRSARRTRWMSRSRKPRCRP
jgi:outer membrane protein TolC